VEDLYSIKRKLETYKKMRQMADAMKLAAITGYSSLSKRTVSVKNYLDKANEAAACLLHSLSLGAHGQVDPLGFFENISSSRSLVIIVGATRELGSGCVGMLKSFLPKIVHPTIESPVDFILLGKSGGKFLAGQPFEENTYRIVREIKDFSFHGLTEIVSELADFVSSKELLYKKCMVVNMRFKSWLAHQRNAKVILPLSSNQDVKEALVLRKQERSSAGDYLLEQDAFELGVQLRKKLVYISLLYEIVESLTAENVSRYIAMDKAVTNADKCIDEISLKMNKARQVMITKQITEISCYTDS
jgi:F-type H+-transporting ATPase subunit gamma